MVRRCGNVTRNGGHAPNAGTQADVGCGRPLARPDVFELRVHTGERSLIETISTPARAVGADPEAQKPSQT